MISCDSIDLCLYNTATSFWPGSGVISKAVFLDSSNRFIYLEKTGGASNIVYDRVTNTSTIFNGTIGTQFEFYESSHQFYSPSGTELNIFGMNMTLHNTQISTYVPDYLLALTPTSIEKGAPLYVEVEYS